MSTSPKRWMITNFVANGGLWTQFISDRGRVWGGRWRVKRHSLRGVVEVSVRRNLLKPRPYIKDCKHLLQVDVLVRTARHYRLQFWHPSGIWMEAKCCKRKGWRDWTELRGILMGEGVWINWSVRGEGCERVDGTWRRTTDSVASKLNLRAPNVGFDNPPLIKIINFYLKHGKIILGGGELCVEGKPHILVLVMNNPRCGTDIYHTSVFEQAP